MRITMHFGLGVEASFSSLDAFAENWLKLASEQRATAGRQKTIKQARFHEGQAAAFRQVGEALKMTSLDFDCHSCEDCGISIPQL